MDSVLRAIFVYLLLFVIFRASGKRTLQESSPFGMVLIFLISSSVADILKDEDRSITNGVVLAVTLVLMHLGFSYLKRDSTKLAKVIEDVPTLLVHDGQLLKQRMKDARVTREDILAAAREEQLGYINQIKYAILETNGTIRIIPKEKSE
jgi:uncharacterized membrane protein YcaP (DUF421 family)